MAEKVGEQCRWLKVTRSESQPDWTNVKGKGKLASVPQSIQQLRRFGVKPLTNSGEGWQTDGTRLVLSSF